MSNNIFEQAVWQPLLIFALDWQPQTPPLPVDGQQWAGPAAPKARGRFRAGLRNGPLRWMRDWGPAANNRPPFWGRSARRGGAARIGNDTLHLYICTACMNGVSVWLALHWYCHCRFICPSFFRLWRGGMESDRWEQWLKKCTCLIKRVQRLRVAYRSWHCSWCAAKAN